MLFKISLAIREFKDKLTNSYRINRGLVWCWLAWIVAQVLLSINAGYYFATLSGFGLGYFTLVVIMTFMDTWDHPYYEPEQTKLGYMYEQYGAILIGCVFVILCEIGSIAVWIITGSHLAGFFAVFGLLFTIIAAGIIMLLSWDCNNNIYGESTNTYARPTSPIYNVDRTEYKYGGTGWRANTSGKPTTIVAPASPPARRDNTELEGFWDDTITYHDYER